MEVGEAESDPKRELNDSGYVHEAESPPKKPQDCYEGQAQLLDLSDDVLLCILKYCSPHDLKALGFTCARLGALVLERSLWTVVDARDVPSGISRVAWYLQAVHPLTRELMLTGLAKEAKGCLGHINRPRKEVESEQERARRGHRGDGDNNNVNDTAAQEESREEANPPPALEPPYPLFRQHARLHINAHQLPRISTSPSWPDDPECDPEIGPTDTGPKEPGQAETGPAVSGPTETGPGCNGPQFTLTAPALRALRERCPLLASLSLDYCNINCRKTSIHMFPPTLNRLSLRGSKCYNLPLDTSFLFKIHDSLPLLEFLDLSECEWLEPAALLPLSKMPALLTLLMRQCSAMTEFVAYVSLATRYGFRKLKVLDFRGSPVGDPEVSALGWLPALEELRLAAPRPERRRTHTHYRGERLLPAEPCQRWETQEPEYYRSRARLEAESPDSSVEDVEEQVDRLRERFTNAAEQICIEVHTRPHEMPPEIRRVAVPRRLAIRREPYPQERYPLKRRADNQNEAGPSQRRRVERNSERNESPSNSGDSPVKGESATNGGESANDSVESAKSSDDSAKSENMEVDKKSEHSQSTENIDESAESANMQVDKKSEQSSADDVKRDKTKCASCNKDENDSSDEAISDNSEGEKPKRPPKGESSKTDSPQGSKCECPKAGPSKRDNSSNTDSSNVVDCHSFEINYGGPSTSAYSVNININNEIPYRRNPETPNTPRRRRIVRPLAENDNASNVPPRPENAQFQQYVRFRQNQDPVVIQCPRQEQEVVEPRHHVLYVNLGQQLHAVYRLLPNRPTFTARNRNFRSPDRLDSSSLVTDSAIFRFGRADGEDVNIVNIGPNGPQFGARDVGGRPNRSNLRVLIATGYRSITNRSLVHLTTAAPHLRLIDFSNSGVTADGVENFRSLRPECEVIHSQFKIEFDELEEVDD